MKIIDKNISDPENMKQLVSGIKKTGTGTVLDADGSLYLDIKKVIEDAGYL